MNQNIEKITKFSQESISRFNENVQKGIEISMGIDQNNFLEKQKALIEHGLNYFTTATKHSTEFLADLYKDSVKTMKK